MFQGCSGVVPGCSDGVPGVFRGVPGVFRGVPGCSGVFRECSGFYRHPFSFSTPSGTTDLHCLQQEQSLTVCTVGMAKHGV